MRGLVEGDPSLELLFADVAPRADVVRGDGDVEVCHFAEVGSQDDGVGCPTRRRRLGARGAFLCVWRGPGSDVRKGGRLIINLLPSSSAEGPVATRWVVESPVARRRLLSAVDAAAEGRSQCIQHLCHISLYGVKCVMSPDDVTDQALALASEFGGFF